MIDKLKNLKTNHLALGVGVGLAALAMAMTYRGGRSIDVSDPEASFLIGCACALISAGVAIGLHIVDSKRAAGDTVAARTWLRLWYAMLVFEVCAAAIFTVGHRAANVDQALAQAAKYQTAGVIATDKRKSLDDLKGELEAFQAVNPWSLTADTAGLEAELSLAKDKIELEASRGGCKDKCLQLKAKAADIEKRIGALAKRNALTAKMEALAARVEQTAVAAVATDRGSSAVAEASLMFARFGTLNLEPGKDAVGWATNISGLVMSIIFSISGAMMLREGLKEFVRHGAGYTPDLDHGRLEPVKMPAPPVPAPAPAVDTSGLRNVLSLMQSPGANRETIVLNNGLTREAIRSALEGQGLLKAAA